MQVQRGYVEHLSIAILLASLSALLDRPSLLIGTIAIYAWLLSNQSLYISELKHIHDSIEITQRLSVPQVATDKDIQGTLNASIDKALLPIEVEIDPPIATHITGNTKVSLKPENTASTTYKTRFNVAGKHRYRQPRVTVESTPPFFKEQFRKGNTEEITVEPRTPRNIHIGVGGTRVAVYGEHRSDKRGAGLTPTEVRRYVPGDPASRINWKATARLNEPYVYDAESESDRATVLIFDHGDHLETGQEGETELNYLREVAIAFVNNAKDLSDTLALYTIDGEGITMTKTPRASGEHYIDIKNALQSIKPSSPIEKKQGGWSAGTANRAKRLLVDGEDSFGEKLTPYLSDSSSYVKRIETNPIFEVVDDYVTKLEQDAWVVIFTDDTNKQAVIEAVKLASQGNNEVTVFLTPNILFRETGLGDIEDAYSEYIEFEEFRRKLEALPGVTAFEIGPRDRIKAVLSQGKQRRRAAGND